MKTLTWYRGEDVRIDEVPHPRIEEPTDAIIRVTSTASCGSDLHLDNHAVDDLPAVLRDRTLGRGPDAVIDAVGIEAPGRRSQLGRDS